jgi:cytochrome oxidase assembly protein ShyY1
MSALKGGLLLVPSAVAATMAAWQIQRMQWKVSLVVPIGGVLPARLAAAAANIHVEPLSLQQEVVETATRNMEQPPVDLLRGTVPEFRRVAMQGVYDHSRAAFVGPRPLRCATS